MLLKKQFSFFLSSDPESGATNVAADGSSFQVNLNSPIMIPPNAVSAELSVIQANVWNDSANISATFENNVFNFTTNHSGVPVEYNYVIPDGLYSLSALNSYLATQFVNSGLPANLITITGDSATQKTILTFLIAGDFCDFTVADSVREILGFDSRVAPNAPQVAGWNEFSDDPAQFNRTNSYLIESDIVSEGIPVNTFNQGIIASVPIDVAPGSQIVYQPRTPLVVDATELIGSTKQQIQVRLLNQSLEQAPTNEIFSVVINMVYNIPV